MGQMEQQVLVMRFKKQQGGKHSWSRVSRGEMVEAGHNDELARSGRALCAVRMTWFFFGVM